MDPTPLCRCDKLDSGSFDCITGNEFLKLGWLETLLSAQHFAQLFPKDRHVDSWGPWRYDVPRVLSSLDTVSFYLPLVKDGEPVWKALHLLHSAVSVSGFQWAGMLDIDPAPLLERLLKEEPLERNEAMRKEVIRVLCKQIDKNGTTIGLNVDKMTENGELALRVSKVLDTRRAEMESAYIGITTENADLHSLWLTGYGHRILSEMGLGVNCKPKELGGVLLWLKELGFEVGLVDTSELKFPNCISEPMREYIWRLAEYRAHGEGP
jgi:hypothetical protein